MPADRLNIALVGSGFMGRAHALAYTMLPLLFDVEPRPVLHTLADLTADLAREGAEKLGFPHWSADWRRTVSSPEIDVVHITTPNNMHREIAMTAIEHGKHIYCEKPLALTVAEAREMYQAAERRGIQTAVGFNYRKNPGALYMKQLVDSGQLGRMFHFRGTFLQDWGVDPRSPLSWRFQKAIAGSGSLGDLGSHVLDFVRFLIGEVSEVCALTETFVKQRPLQTGTKDAMATAAKGAADDAPRGAVDVDDAVVSLLRFENGAIGTLEATRFATGHKSQLQMEINGSGGSLIYDHHRMNEFQLYLTGDEGPGAGFRTVMVGPEHPYYAAFWPVAALGIGFEDTKVIDFYRFLRQITAGEPGTSTFYDGYKVEQITEAIAKSAEERRWVRVDAI